MNKPVNQSSIRQIPLFAALSDDEFQDLTTQSLHQAWHPAGAILFREGEPGDRFSIIIEGQIEIIKSFETEEERLLAVRVPGEYLGEVSLLYPDRLRSATARARTDVSLFEMKPDDFERLIQNQANLALLLIRELIQRDRHSENLIIQDLQEKNRRLAQTLSELQLAQEQLLEKETLELELDIARKIQKSSLPKSLPTLPSWELAVYWQPARAVGGDFYDFIQLSDSKLMIVIGDVTGKGVPAALVMATTQSMLRFSMESGADGQRFSPSEVLTRLNELSHQTIPTNMFITCLIAEIDLESGQMNYANAGHNLPYLRRSEGIIELRAVGMPLGLMPNMTYEKKEAWMARGECLLLYSDGFVEAHNPQKEMYGLPRFLSHLSENPGGEGLIHHVLEDLAEFTGSGWEQEDDMTCLVLKRLFIE